MRPEVEGKDLVKGVKSWEEGGAGNDVSKQITEDREGEVCWCLTSEMARKMCLNKTKM